MREAEEGWRWELKMTYATLVENASTLFFQVWSRLPGMLSLNSQKEKAIHLGAASLRVFSGNMSVDISLEFVAQDVMRLSSPPHMQLLRSNYSIPMGSRSVPALVIILRENRISGVAFLLKGGGNGFALSARSSQHFAC